jgi:hypothetical protein
VLALVLEIGIGCSTLLIQVTTNNIYMPDKDHKQAMESLQHFARRKRESSSRGGLFLAGFVLILLVVAFLYLFAR